MTRYADLSRYAYMPDSVPDGVEVLNVGWRRFDHPGGEQTCPVTAQVGGEKVALGSAEVRVAAEDGTWLSHRTSCCTT